ncbi:MAG: MarC family protein [bacterium]
MNFIREWLQPFVLTFIPIFVAMDVLGTLPIFLAVTAQLKPSQRKRIVRDSAITALIIMLVFLFVGKGILLILGITVSDFMVAGGILLIVLAVDIILHEHQGELEAQPTLGIVPFGTPLMAGPAVITTEIILIDSQGLMPTVISVALNVLTAWLILKNSHRIIKYIDPDGLRAVSKVSALLIAAIAVMMIRRGIEDILRNLPH